MAATAHLPESMADAAVPNLDSRGAFATATARHGGDPIALQIEDVYREHFAFVWRSLRQLNASTASVQSPPGVFVFPARNVTAQGCCSV